MALNINPVDFRGFALGAPNAPQLPVIGALGLQAIQARMAQQDTARQIAAQQAMNTARLQSADTLGLRQLALERSKLDMANQSSQKELAYKQALLGQQALQADRAYGLQNRQLGQEDQKLGLLSQQADAEAQYKQDQLGLARNQLDFNKQNADKESAREDLKLELAQFATMKKEKLDNLGAFTLDAKMAMSKVDNPGDARTMQLEILKEAEQNGYIDKDTAEQLKKQPVSTFKNAIDMQLYKLNKVKDYVALQKLDNAGKGSNDNITITRPDGTTVQVQGLTQLSKTKLQSSLVDKEKTLNQFDILERDYNPEYFTYANQGVAKLSEEAEKTKGLPLIGSGLNYLADKLSGMSGDERAAFLEKRQSYMNTVNQIFNAYKKEITGSAAAEKEIQDLKDSFLNGDMSASQFKGGLEQIKEKYKDEAAAARLKLKEGQVVSEPKVGREYYFNKLKAMGYSEDKINNLLDSKGIK